MAAKYHLFHLTFFILSFYLITFLLYRFHFIPKKFHRRVWNITLLMSFLISALIGLFSAIKINYKLEIPGYEKLLELHVEGGIVMAITGVIHLIWHFSYYIEIFSKKNNNKTLNESGSSEFSEKKLKVFLFLLGWVSTGLQILFIREFFTVFYGNELVFGLILCLWLLFSGIGAYAFNNPDTKVKPGKIPQLIWFYTWFMIAMIVVTFIAKHYIFIRGEQVRLFGIFTYASVILFVPCFISGYLFSFIASLISFKENKIGISYGNETIGGIIGGFAVNFILVFFFNSFQIAAILLTITHLALIATTWKNKSMIILMIITVFTSVLFFLPETEKTVRQFLYKPSTITRSYSLPSGSIDITENNDQIAIYHNNVLLNYSQNAPESEERVHYTMLLHPDPESVLLISNGNPGIIKEIQKYKSVKKVDIIESDKWASKKLQKLYNLDSLHFLPKIINKDIRTYLKSAGSKYDIILVSVPGPSNLYFNRFYTVEFFSRIQDLMNPGAILSIRYMAGINYLNDNERTVMGLINNSLSSVFKHVKIISADNYYFLASDFPLILDYEKSIIGKGIQNEYVNEYYLNDNLILQRSKLIEEDIMAIRGVNHDLYPLAFLHQIKVYMDYNKIGYKTLGAVLLLIFILIFIKLNNTRKSLLLSSFTGLSLEVTALFLVQVYVGNAFYISGIIITFFMTSIAFGAYFHGKVFKINDKRSYDFIVLLYATTCLILTIVFLFLDSLSQNVIIFYLILSLVIFLSGFFSGAIFSKATLIDKEGINQNVSANYTTDLIGASFGALLTGIYLIPLLGMSWTILALGSYLFIVSGLNLALKLK